MWSIAKIPLLKAYMEDWVGDKGMPKHIGGWQNGKKCIILDFKTRKDLT